MLNFRICLNVICLISLSHTTYATVYQVKSGESIQQIIDQSSAHDTIEIHRGTYYENILINKPLNIKGVNRPTINGSEQGDVIRITVPDVVIDNIIVTGSGRNLTAQNAGIYVEPGSNNIKITNCDITYNLFGLWIEKVDHAVIENNLITGKRDLRSASRGNGIQLYRSSHAKIINNHISFARDGIYVDVSHHALFSKNKIHHVRYGTHYMNSYHNEWSDNEVYRNRGGLALMEVRNQVVKNNKAWGNTDHGIMLRTIQDAVVEGNLVYQNRRGFFIYDAEYNKLINNQIINNYVGIHLWAGSINNEVTGNSFIRNKEQIRYVATKDVFWNKNFWSNYNGWDRNGDNIGDVPYVANDMVDKLVWKIPSMKLLLNSPAIQTLKLVTIQFPILRSFSVVDKQPLMEPNQ